MQFQKLNEQSRWIRMAVVFLSIVFSAGLMLRSRYETILRLPQTDEVKIGRWFLVSGFSSDETICWRKGTPFRNRCTASRSRNALKVAKNLESQTSSKHIMRFTYRNIRTDALLIRGSNSITPFCSGNDPKPHKRTHLNTDYRRWFRSTLWPISNATDVHRFACWPYRHLSDEWHWVSVTKMHPDSWLWSIALWDLIELDE